MTDYLNRLGVKFGLGKETTRGTSVAPSYWLKHLDADFLDKSTVILNESAQGVIEKNSDGTTVETWGAGKIDGKITDQAFGLILLALFGQTSSDANHSGETTVKDHTFSMAETATPTSLTIVRKDGNENQRFARAMLDKLEVDVVVGDYVKFSSEWFTAPGVTGTDTAAYVAENEFKASYATVKHASAIAGLSGATADPIKSLKLTFERHCNPYYVFGSTAVADIFSEGVEVSGEIVLRHSDQSFHDLWKNGTYQALLLDIVNTDVNIGVVPSHPEIQFQLNQVVFDSWVLDQSIDKIAEQTLTFKGLYKIADTAMMSAILTNTVASY